MLATSLWRCRISLLPKVERLKNQKERKVPKRKVLNMGNIPYMVKWTRSNELLSCQHSIFVKFRYFCYPDNGKNE